VAESGATGKAVDLGEQRARARVEEVDVTRIPRAEWRRRNEAAGLGTI